MIPFRRFLARDEVPIHLPMQRAAGTKHIRFRDLAIWAYQAGEMKSMIIIDIIIDDIRPRSGFTHRAHRQVERYSPEPFTSVRQREEMYEVRAYDLLCDQASIKWHVGRVEWHDVAGDDEDLGMVLVATGSESRQSKLGGSEDADPGVHVELEAVEGGGERIVAVSGRVPGDSWR